MISILIVNWNGDRYIADCLDSIRERVSGAYEVVVVDNDSADGSAELVAERYPWVKLVRSGENLGFAKGNNLAARSAVGAVLLLLNYDTVLLADPAAVAAGLEADRSVGCVGARMCDGAGRVVANCGRFPSPLRLLLFASMFWRPYKGTHGVGQRVDWVEGSWLLIRRETWQRVGGFDDRIFMYGEDVDLCRCVAGLGLVVMQVPVLAYRHYTGWSAKRLPYQFAGFRFFHRKHSGLVVRGVAEAVLWVGLRVRVGVYAVLAGVTGRERFREKAAALRRVVRLWGQMLEPGFGSGPVQ